MKDDEILKRIRLGDEKVLDYLYQKYYRMMTKIVLSNNGTEDEAKDVYQEALLSFWKKAMTPDFKLTSKISTYLYSVCLNQWRKELSRKTRFTSEQVDSPEYQKDSLGETEKIVHECIASLGEVCRKVLSYYYFDGMSMKQIAKTMEFANADTAKTKKYKCKKRLDELIKEKYSRSDFFDN